MFCPHCGSSIPDGSKFCGACGSPIETQDAQPSYGGYADQQAGYTEPQTGYMPDANFAPPAPETNYAPPAPSYPIEPAQPAYATTPSAGAVRTDRDLVTYILLSLVTCGIYGWWYVYQMAQDTNVMCAADGDETPGLGIYILLSLVTCGIYSYYWLYKLGNRLQSNGGRYGVPIQEGGSDVLLWLVLGYFTCSITTFIGMNIIIKNLNALAEGYNRSMGLTYVRS